MSDTTKDAAWAPDRIWLQREQGEGGSHTWCEDSVGDGDLIEEVEYVRADRAQVQAEKDAKTAELHKMLANIMHDQTTAMQSALIEWKHGKGAEAGLQWIVNTLMGPGLLPDFDAEHGTNAQFWFDANRAEPFPKCFCGNPSHMLWMGQGFCCDAHYDEAKAKRDTAPSTGDQS